MLMNNLDPEVAERPEDLVVYGGIGKAARNWDAFEAIVRTLKVGGRRNPADPVGKAGGRLPDPPGRPRVLIANSNLVPHWATWDHFHGLDRKGLIMYGQMTAGSWIYIGSQGIVQGTMKPLPSAPGAISGDPSNTPSPSPRGWRDGGAQPLAVTLNEGVIIAVEVGRSRIQRRLQTRYLDRMAESLDEAVRLAMEAKEAGNPFPSGFWGMRRRFCRRWFPGDHPGHRHRSNLRPRPPERLHPPGNEPEEAAALRKSDPQKLIALAKESMAIHVRAMLEMQKRGAVAFDYGNNIRQVARMRGGKRVRLPRLCPCLHPAVVLRRKGHSGGWPCQAIRKTFTRRTK